MSFETDLKAHLQNDAVISAIVAERIFPVVVPQNTPVPAITYTHVFGQPENSLDGFTSGLTRYAMQIDIWCATNLKAIELALAVRDRLNVAAATFRTVITDLPALEEYEAETKRYRKSIGVACWFSE